MPVVAWQNGLHDALTDAIQTVASEYEPSTWRDYLPIAEEALNDYLTPIPGTEIPVAFADRTAAIKLVEVRLREDSAAVRWRGVRFEISFPDNRPKAVRTHIRTQIARRILDVARMADPGLAPNCFVRDDWVPGTLASKRDNAEVWASDTGRLFTIAIPRSAPKTSGDPHLHDKIDRAFTRFGKSICVHRGWQTKEDWRCRGGEAFEVTFRSLHQGAIELGAKRFCRLVVIRDKPSGPLLRKYTAFSEKFEAVFYDSYLDGERKELDGGRGRRHYEEACWDGDEAALGTPVFLNHWRNALTADTAATEFRRVVRRAGIKCGDRPAWMHLGRADSTVKALDDIEALDAPQHVKERMRYELAEYMGWASKDAMLQWYGARHFAARRAADTIAFQNRHGRIGGLDDRSPIYTGQLAHSSFADAADLDDIFSD